MNVEPARFPCYLRVDDLSRPHDGSSRPAGLLKFVRKVIGNGWWKEVVPQERGGDCISDTDRPSSRSAHIVGGWMSCFHKGEGSRGSGIDAPLDEDTELDFLPAESKSPDVFGAFWILLFAAGFLVGGPWAGFHGVLLACVAVLMFFFPSQVSLPRHWWFLALAFVCCGSLSFLPAAWFGAPGWRTQLMDLGVETGSMVALQVRQAGEMLALFTIMVVTGLWLAGHRPSPSRLRLWALSFACGVAAYAIAAKLMQPLPHEPLAAGQAEFGFFPNRNHSATYLAMGFICGLGCVVQALRDKRFVSLALAVAATAVCLWAVTAWSVSRAGVVLVALACLIWLPILGRRYLGRHGLWAVGLMSFTAVGLFFIADSRVKDRLTHTVQKANVVIGAESPSSDGGEQSVMEASQSLDFRIPTALDTFDLIRDFPWTGIGAGQYVSVFPQYRNRTAVANNAVSVHPESDWLWMASEAGVPGALALATLVILASWKSLSSIRLGRNRALRGACLVAALLVPIHGIFDVPGHRITLAWSAAFLFALSLPQLSSLGASRAPARWLFRLAGAGIGACAVFLICGQWLGGPQSAVVIGENAHRTAMGHYEEDQIRLKAAQAAGQEYQPAPGEDLLEDALQTLKEAARLAPLDSRVRYLQGYIGLHFDEFKDESAAAFAIEGALNPTPVHVPMRQGVAWSRADPERAVAHWKDALVRAKALDAKSSGAGRFTENAYAEILNTARGNARLESLVEELVPQ